ncbi:HD domain-containing phosphohydrolase [Desulfomonile tiedjei]|uniref:PAS domain S-box n=1 Tax=Desulfomonile tiedjei (strain ATCC 49306 / DSM 6799 / DCB-1) TaxID=706587 RepID=I4C6V8_DESTA|nr:HD domain-containing phosphohydrolase [Desulfomonile tiedjei]AFM25299.1 PAS domain S-box [Desulfomonile tiedjei DSM 6799]
MDRHNSKEELVQEIRALRRKINELENQIASTLIPGKHEVGPQPATEFGRKFLEAIRTKDFLQGILDSSTLVSIVLTDLDQNVLFWNTGAQNIFGYSSDEMIGSKITRLYPPDALSTETVEQLRTVIRTKSGAVHGNMQQLTKDGRTLIISLALSPMIDTDGEVQGILGVGLDVTEEILRQEEILKLLEQVQTTQDMAVFSLAKLAESRDAETGSHLIRIQKYCRILCNRLSDMHQYRDIVTDHYTTDLIRSAVLHDIGKVAMPDSILLSHELFTVTEREIMKRHTLLGGKALEEAVTTLGEKSFLSLGMEVAYYHHEKWDGTGYPYGLKGEEIPLSARIVSLVDVYDALTSERRYKRPFSHEEASLIIQEGRANHFDPGLVDAFSDVQQEFHIIRDAIAGPLTGSDFSETMASI